MAEQVVVCPHCSKTIQGEETTRLVRRGIPRFKWWVAPVNIFFISILYYLLELGINTYYDVSFPWSIWAIVGTWLLYLLGLGLTYRTEDSWILVPVFFTLLSLFLASIDWALSSQITIFIGLSWSFYPIVVIMILLVILPLVTFLGRKQKLPITVLREIVRLEEKELSND